MCPNIAAIQWLMMCRDAYQKYGGKYFLLFLVFTSYILLGALTFYVIESEHEVRQRYMERLRHQQQRTEFIEQHFMNELFNNSLYSLKLSPRKTDLVRETFVSRLILYENQLRQSNKDKTNVGWTFGNALLYAMRLITTIGNAEVKTQTDGGKVTTMVFVLFGVPLTITVLHNLSRPFVLLLTYPGRVIRCCWNCIRFCGNKQPVVVNLAELEEAQAHPSSSSNSAKQILRSSGISIASQKRITSADVPISLAVIAFAAWLTAGAFLYCYAQNTDDLLDALYVSFTFMTTVGSDHHKSSSPKSTYLFLLFLVHVIIGLALLSVLMDAIRTRLLIAYKKPAPVKPTSMHSLHNQHPAVTYTQLTLAEQSSSDKGRKERTRLNQNSRADIDQTSYSNDIRAAPCKLEQCYFTEQTMPYDKTKHASDEISEQASAVTLGVLQVSTTLPESRPQTKNLRQKHEEIQRSPVTHNLRTQFPLRNGDQQAATIECYETPSAVATTTSSLPVHEEERASIATSHSRTVQTDNDQPSLNQPPNLLLQRKAYAPFIQLLSPSSSSSATKESSPVDAAERPFSEVLVVNNSKPKYLSTTTTAAAGSASSSTTAKSLDDVTRLVSSDINCELETNGEEEKTTVKAVFTA